MGITEQWNGLAATLKKHICFKENVTPVPTEVLDLVCAPFEAAIVVHRMGQTAPAYLNPAARQLLGIGSGTINPTVMLKWYVRQRNLSNATVADLLTHFSMPDAPLLMLCTQITDTQGNTQWFCGTCGVVCMPNGVSLLLAIFHSLQALHLNGGGSAPDAKTLALLASLTIREREVLQLLGAQWKADRVAKALHISTHTVASHRKSLMSKLSARTVIALAPFAALLPAWQPPSKPTEVQENRPWPRFGTGNGNEHT